MGAKRLNDNNECAVTRPLAAVAEEEIIKYATQKNPLTKCACHFIATKERATMKEMLNKLSCPYPQIKNSLIAAQERLITSHLLDKSFRDK